MLALESEGAAVAGSFDYIIVGAGSAGCVLARRLTDDPAVRVLLIEAGPPGGGLKVETPAGAFAMMGDARLNWLYPVEPDKTRGGREQIFAAGRLLGGSSAINGMVYNRGLKSDFDGWAQDGCPGWNYADVLPYFLRSEGFHGRSSHPHGKDGPLAVSPLRTLHPLARSFVEACSEAGLPPRDDYCDGEQFGAFLNWTTTRNGKRCSAYEAFLRPVRNRPNLRILTGMTVDRLSFTGTRATGVECVHDGIRHQYSADGEILISAGTMGSPPILQRSGIGPGDDLAALSIPVVADLPVGRNLQEHPSLPVSKLIDMPSYNSPMGPAHIAMHMLRYLLFKRGPMTSSAAQAVAYGKTRPELPIADMSFYFLPLAIDMSQAIPGLHKKPGLTIMAQQCRANARGTVRLRNASPMTRPVIDYPMMGDENDLATIIAGGKMCEQIFAASPLARHVVADNQPPSRYASDDEWKDYVREMLTIGFHPAGTCRMGSDERAVVDPQLRVRRIEGLRVVDASVMPRLLSGNTNAGTIMIAEKAAEMLLRDRRAVACS